MTMHLQSSNPSAAETGISVESQMDTSRNNNVIITSKRRRGAVLT